MEIYRTSVSKRNRKKLSLVEVDQSIHIEKIFDAAKEGGTIAELAANAISDDEISAEEAMEFIYELINNQVW